MKKSLLLALCIALCAAISLGGTLAFLSDSEEAVNVMTVGKVDIELNEYMRDEDGDELVDFENPQKLLPIVGSAQEDPKDNWGLTTAKNYVDKMPTIKNVERSDAWVRLIVAVPTGLGLTDENANEGDVSSNVLHWNFANRFDADKTGKYNDIAWNTQDNPFVKEWFWDAYNTGETGCAEAQQVTIDGMEYTLYVFTRQQPLARNEETTPVISGFYIDEHVDYNDEDDVWEYVVIDKTATPATITRRVLNYDLDNGVVIPVMAQAVQADGFDTPAQAFEAAFGDKVEDDKLYVVNPWGELNVSYIHLNEAIAAGGTVEVNETIEGDSLNVPAGTDVSVELNGNQIITQNGFVNSGTAVVENGTLTDESTGGYGTQTTIGGETTYNNVNIETKAGGVNVWGTAVWNGGNVTTESQNTSARHVFYVAGGAGAKGHLTINGGEFTFSPSNLTRKGSYLCAHGADATIIVNGGTFNKPSTRTAPIQAIDGGTVIINAGKFMFDPSDYVPATSEVTKDGDWWIVTVK